jgi:putative SOS response-associated peptidase YedK
VPLWAPDPSVGSRLINARAESVTEKPAFRDAFARRRCIIPADGFYEWHDRQPWYLFRPEGGILGFAGLWERWHPPGEDDRVLRSCTVVTTRASEDLASLHDRMPVILAPEHYSTWLDGEAEQEELVALLQPLPAGSLRTVRVGKAVGNAGNEGPELIEPVAEGFDEAPAEQGRLFA